MEHPQSAREGACESVDKDYDNIESEPLGVRFACISSTTIGRITCPPDPQPRQAPTVGGAPGLLWQWTDALGDAFCQMRAGICEVTM